LIHAASKVVDELDCDVAVILLDRRKREEDDGHHVENRHDHDRGRQGRIEQVAQPDIGRDMNDQEEHDDGPEPDRQSIQTGQEAAYYLHEDT
jgi:hypothetical protein